MVRWDMGRISLQTNKYGDTMVKFATSKGIMKDKLKEMRRKKLKIKMVLMKRMQIKEN